MLALLLALAAEPAARDASAASPIVVRDTAMIVSGLMGRYEANIRVVIENTGTEADEVVSVSTPLGEALEFRTDGNMFSRQAPVALPIAVPVPADGKPAYLPLVVRVSGLTQGDYWSTGAPITVRFAHAGERVLTAKQVVPSP
jgi:hypothetical protein